MGWCRLSERKVRRLRQDLNVPEIVWASVRGGSGHAIYLHLKGGHTLILHRDGTTRMDQFGWSDGPSISEKFNAMKRKRGEQ